MANTDSDNQETFLHCAALYKQLYSIYPKEHKHLQHQIEALIQLEEHDEAELLLDQLHALLLSQGLTDEAQQAESIRQHISQKKHAEQYYSAPFLHLASRNVIKRIFQEHQRIHLDEGEHLIRFGDTGKQMYIVLSGELAVWSRNHQGKKHFEHTLKAGEVIGELAFLDHTPRNADVLACGDCSLLAIPAKAAYKLFMDNPKIEASLRREADIRQAQVLLKCNQAFAALPHHVQRILAKEGRVLHHQPLQRIYQGNESIQYIDLVCKGFIHFVGEHNNGSSLMLHAIKTGGLIGCSALIPNMDVCYSADVVAMADVTRIRLPLSCIQKVCDLNPRLYQALMQYAETERNDLLRSLSKSEVYNT